MIQKEIKERKEVLSNYNGDYLTYVNKGNVMPLYVIVLNNYEIFEENFSTQFDDLMQTLTREVLECGMIFITTLNSSGGMRYRLKQSFSKRIALKLNSDDEFYSIFEKVVAKRPANKFGRGLVSIGDKNGDIFEFQVAKFSNPENYNKNVEELIEKTNKRNVLVAKPIRALPEVLKMEDVLDCMEDISGVPIGMKKNNLEVYKYDFKNNFITIIGAQNMSNSIDFFYNVINEIKTLKNINIHKIDPEIIRESKNYSLHDEFNNFMIEIEKEAKAKDDVFNVCLIVGIDKFITEGNVDLEKFNDTLLLAKNSGKHSFIIIDNANHLKEHSLDNWYKNFINADSGIWIGKGVCEQRLIGQSLGLFSEENSCSQSFGFIIKDREVTLLKMLGMKDNV